MKISAVLAVTSLLLVHVTMANAEMIELLCVDPANEYAVDVMVDTENSTATAGPAAPSHAYVDSNSIMFATSTSANKFYINISRESGEMTVYLPDGSIDSIIPCRIRGAER